MSNVQWAVLALAALLVFWMVGAYNRLVALRNGIASAWAQIDMALAHRAAAVAPLLAAVREPLHAEAGALDTFVATHADAAKAAAALRERPVAPASAAAWVKAETVLAAAASRLLALIEQQAELRADVAVNTLLATWREGGSQLVFARRMFDTAAEAYNHAASQLPTRWLLRLFGFGRAGVLSA